MSIVYYPTITTGFIKIYFGDTKSPKYDFNKMFILVNSLNKILFQDDHIYDCQYTLDPIVLFDKKLLPEKNDICFYYSNL